jgi:hypothetical protein
VRGPAVPAGVRETLVLAREAGRDGVVRRPSAEELAHRFRRTAPLWRWWGHHGQVVLLRLALATLVVSGVGAVNLVQDGARHRDAVRLAVEGQVVEAYDVWTNVVWRRTGHEIAAVEVTYRVGEAEVTTLLAGDPSAPTTAELGWWPAEPGVYGEPLRVVHLPDQPRTAMAVVDLKRATAWTPTQDRLLVAVGLLPSLLLVVRWWRLRARAAAVRRLRERNLLAPAPVAKLDPAAPERTWRPSGARVGAVPTQPSAPRTGPITPWPQPGQTWEPVPSRPGPPAHAGR